MVNFFRRIGFGFVKFIKEIDKPLIIAAVALSVFGIFAISSATMSTSSWERCMIVQSFALGLGIILMSIISRIDYELICKFFPWIAILCSAALILTAVIADDVGGNKNWINLGFFNLQTSEFTKIAFAITFSAHLKKVGEKMNKIGNILLLCLHFALYAVPVLLQKDMGSALVYVGMFLVLMFVAGIYYRYIIIAGVLGVAAVPIIWEYLSGYQKARIIYGIQPELDPLHYGLQPLIARMAIGSGGFSGLGYGNGIQTQNDLLPASNTDFIYAIVGEEFGFIGCIGIILALLVIVALIFINGAKATEKTGYYICTAIAAMIIVQACINIGMNIGVSPVIGITLPFVSYGGSSILSLFIGLGVVQSVRKRPEKVLKFTLGRDKK